VGEIFSRLVLIVPWR